MIEQTKAEKQNQENAKQKAELISAYKRMSMTDDGKIILADLESKCGFRNSSVCTGSPNPYQTFFAEGKRWVYLMIEGYLRKEEK